MGGGVLGEGIAGGVGQIACTPAESGEDTGDVFCPTGGKKGTSGKVNQGSRA